MHTESNTIQTIIDAMTAEEKAHLLTGGSSFSSYPIERLGIPRIQYLDGGTGINWEQLMSDWMDADTGTIRTVLSHFNEPESLSKELQAVRAEFIRLLKEHGCPDRQPGCYPPGILLGATWDPEVVRECGRALGQEALDFHVDILLGTPNVNLHRDPLNGRLFEGYSEDPCLTAALAPQLTLGVQESGVLANVKHFAANNLEAYRQGIDESIPERVLQELYLPAFRACVTEGHAATLMTAYNRINGIACTENRRLLQDVLRTEWGFGDGLIISDWGAVYHQAAAIAAGNDVDMPGPRDVTPILEALENGSLTEEALDLAVSHMLRAIFHTPTGRRTAYGQKLLAEEKALQPSDDVAPSAAGTVSMSYERCRNAAYRGITEGAVLLRNRNETLPLRPGARILLIGEEIAHIRDCGDGSARVYTDQKTELPEEFRKDPSYHVELCLQEPTADRLKDFDYGILAVCAAGQEGRDRSSLSLSEAQTALIRLSIDACRSSGARLILLLNICGPVDLSFCSDDLDAILCIFYPGMEGGRGIKDLLTGAVNPSGKLPITFPRRPEDCPTYLNRPAPDRTVVYGEGLYVGYRYYDKKGIAPLYPFGWGLSYTAFHLEPPELDASHAAQPDGYLQITSSLQNTGSRDGKEVVQLYVEDVYSTLEKPLRELKAFQKLFVRAGEQQPVVFRLPLSALAAFDPFYGEWMVEPGFYRFYLGQSSRQLTAPVTLRLPGDDRYRFSADTPFIRILDHPTAYPTLLSVCSAYGITESDFQGFAIYTPYFALDRVLDSVVGWRVRGDQIEDAKQEIYRRLKKIPID